jgi:cobalt-precorrin-5B (C1)-methyltransferase
MRRLEHYIQVGQKRLRCGFTTGTCAAAAARAAAELLLKGSSPDIVSLQTPAGIVVEAEIEEAHIEGKTAYCAVRKDGGDDPDITDGILIFAAVSQLPQQEIIIDGGEGVGRVTRPGLDQPVGNAAINSRPRQMIREQLEQVLQETGVSGGLKAVIFIPQGRELAKKTFNPHLGIEGGLSVLGTSGIVRPMSEEALISSIHAEMDMLKAEGVQHLLVSPGNYGADFSQNYLGLEKTHMLQCSNYIGDMLDYAAALQFQSVLLIGHLGKLVKCAAGVMNTHSKVADCRLETLAAHAALNGAGQEVIGQIMQAVTTDAAILILQDAGCLTSTMETITAALGKQLRRRAGEQLPVEAVIFTNQQGILGQTEGAEHLLNLHRKGYQ